MAVHEKEIEIRWRDLDVYGHVNHVVYLTYLEEARDEWLSHALPDPDNLWGYLVARIEIDYRRELSLAEQRFTDLKRSVVGIPPNVLSSRLKALQEDGLVATRELPPPAARISLSERSSPSARGSPTASGRCRSDGSTRTRSSASGQRDSSTSRSCRATFRTPIPTRS